MEHISKWLPSQKTFLVLVTAHLLSLPLPYAFGTTTLIVLLTASVGSVFSHKIQFSKRVFIAFLLYGLMIASLLWTIHFKQSLRGLERQLGFLLVPLAFVCMPRLTKDTIFKILLYFARGMAVFALFFLGNAVRMYFQAGTTEVFFYHELVAIFELNAIYVSVWVALCLLFLFFKAKKNALSSSTLLISGGFLLMLASKAIILVTTLVLILGAFRHFSKKKILIGGLSALLLAILVCSTNNPVRERFWVEYESSNLNEVWNRECFTRTYYWTGTGIRLFQIRIFSEMLEQDPIFWKGYGINTSQDKIVEKHSAYNLYKGFYHFNFHNQYIQAFAELGVFGMLLIVALLGVSLKDYLETKDLLFLCFFFVMATIFISESYLWRQRGIFHFFTLFGLLMHLKATYHSKPHLPKDHQQ